jgi:hypothetical protein
LRVAYRAELGTEPTSETLLILLAQWALETNLGAAWMNWNVGGIKHCPADGRDFTSYPTRETEHGQSVVHSDPSDPTTWFRAYETMEAGLVDYLRTLRHDFPLAWAAAVRGSIGDFGHALKVEHYYTAPEPEYTAALHARRDHLERLLGPDTAPDLAAAATAAAGIAESENEHAGSGDDADPQPTPPSDLPDPPA